jgi:hypothetical protein
MGAKRFSRVAPMTDERLTPEQLAEWRRRAEYVRTAPGSLFVYLDAEPNALLALVDEVERLRGIVAVAKSYRDANLRESVHRHNCKAGCDDEGHECEAYSDIWLAETKALIDFREALKGESIAAPIQSAPAIGDKKEISK